MLVRIASSNFMVAEEFAKLVCDRGTYIGENERLHNYSSLYQIPKVSDISEEDKDGMIAQLNESWGMFTEFNPTTIANFEIVDDDTIFEGPAVYVYVGDRVMIVKPRGGKK